MSKQDHTTPAVEDVDGLLFKKIGATGGVEANESQPSAAPKRHTQIEVNELKPVAKPGGKKKKLPTVSAAPGGWSCSYASGSGKQGQDDETVSATSTSEVNSNDDALSIASRLSQLVVEQEEKLRGSSNSVGDSFNRTGATASGWCQPTGELGQRMASLFGSRAGHEQRSGLKQSHSSGDIQATGSARARNDSSQHDIERLARSTGLDPGGGQPVDDQFTSGAPAIQVDNYEERTPAAGHARPRAPPGLRTPQPVRQRTRSVVEMSGSNEVGRLPVALRRNESSSGAFLPERGDLRSLESSRAGLSRSPTPTNWNSGPAPGATRSRSNTAGADKSGQLMLNICRSAWTLSEFDKTFNKQCNEQQEQHLIHSDGGEHESAPLEMVTSGEPLNQAKYLDRKNSANLLIRASKNVLNMSHQAQAQPYACSPNGQQSQQLNGDLGAAMNQFLAKNGNQLEMASGRRPSRTHSIGSFCSSMESFRSGKIGGLLLGARRPRAGPNGKRGHALGHDDQANCCSGCCNLDTLRQHLPVLDWLPAYNLSFLWGDLMAGLAVAVLNISTSLSAAVVAETDLGAAFRSSIINTFVYALLCSSRHTSFGSWSIMSQMLLISVRRALSDELILNRINLGPSASWEPEEYEMWHMNIIVMYTFLIGLVQLVSGLLNLGNIMASFIPEALCSSMIAATAFTMAIGQLANMCGTSNKILWAIEKNTTVLWADLKNPPVDITDLFADLFRWIKQIVLLIKHYEQINLVCVCISIVSVILLALNQYFIQVQLKRIFKRNIFLPSELILLIIMIIVSYLVDLNTNYKVTTCGPIYIEFGAPSLPNLRLFRELWFDSLATALISFTMVFIMAKTYSNKLNYEINCNQELIACGAGNLIGGLFDALPATASFSRTAGQVEAGGNTQMASIINCIVLVVLAELLGHYVAHLPICVMSAILFYGFVRMMTRFKEVFVYWRICKVDFFIWIVTFVAILTLDMVNGFLYGLVFSILTMLYRAQNRRCYMLGSIGTSDVYVPLAKYPLAREIEGIKIFQFCGPVHYVCADLFERLLRQKTRVNVKQILQMMADDRMDLERFNPRDVNLPTHIILDFSMISFIDSAGIHVIKKIIEDYKRVNVTILLASLASHVAAVVKSEPSLWNVYKERFYVTLADAVHCAMQESQQLQKASIIYQQKDVRSNYDC